MKLTPKLKSLNNIIINKNKQDNKVTNNNSNNNNSRTNNTVNKKTAKPLPPPTYVRTYYKSTISFFSKIYEKNDLKWRFLLIFIAGLLMSFTSLFFIQNTGVYIAGTSGIFQAISRIVKIILKKNNVNENTIELIYQLMFYGLYLLFNVPLVIFSYKKIGKNFTILSTVAVVLSNVIPILVNLIPGVKNVFVFGTTQADGEWSGYLYLLDFATTENQARAVSMALYALFAGLINGFAGALALSAGASTGGSDFISYYFVHKKKKPIKTILLIVNTSCILVSSTLGSFIAGGVADSSNWNFNNFISQNLMAGIIYCLVSVTVLNFLFPKDKIIKIQIYSEDVMGIRNYLYAANFNHSLTINTTIGGYSLSAKQNIEIICLFMELPRIIRTLKQYRKDMMITVTLIKGIDGTLSVEKSLN